MSILNRLFEGSKKVQKEKKPKTAESPQSMKKPLKVSYWETEPHWSTGQEDFVRQVKKLMDNSSDEARLELTGFIQKADILNQAVAIGFLGLGPVTPNKIAILSILMFSKENYVASLACIGLWQLVLSIASDSQVATLKQLAETGQGPMDYEVAYGIFSQLMISGMGRDLKVGEMENARKTIGAQLGLSPAKLYS